MINKKIIVIIFFMISSFLNAKDFIKLGNIKIWVKEKKIEINGSINMRKGVIEVFISARCKNAKLHETLLVTDCDPRLLHASLLLIGKNPSVINSYNEKSHVYIYVKWKDNKRSYIYRGEDLIYNNKTHKNMKRTPWIFTGKFIFFKRIKIYGPLIEGVIAATYYDYKAMLNNPLDYRNDDTVYECNTKILPKKGTRVKIIFCASPLKEINNSLK